MFTTVVSTAFVLTGVVTTFLGPILPVLASRWGLSDSRSGYFFTAQFLGSMLGVGISSFLLPRSGFRFSLGLAYLLMAGGVSGLTLATGNPRCSGHSPLGWDSGSLFRLATC